MSIDALHSKMKKRGSALMVDLSVTPDSPPPHFRTAYGDCACTEYCKQLLQCLKGKIPAVRFSLLHFSLLGAQGIAHLSELLKLADSLGFYTLLDVYGLTGAEKAQYAADVIWGQGSALACDAILTSGYFGTEIIRPFLPYCEKEKKDLFIVVKTPGKSSSEIQDLLAGSRTVHVAAADYVNRFAAGTVGKYGFSNVCIGVSAAAGDSVRLLRSKYPKLFMLVDGMDCPGANAKNCSLGFNRLGHGAIVGIGPCVTCAWKESGGDGENFAQEAVAAAERAQKKIDRYVTIL